MEHNLEGETAMQSEKGDKSRTSLGSQFPIASTQISQSPSSKL
jgi:hypothetical protein